MNGSVNRRAFLAAAGVSAASLAAARMARAQQRNEQQPARVQQRDPDRPGLRPTVISSGNGQRATAKALAMLREGADPLDAVVAGVAIIEDDPNDMTVGLGGLPNEEGIVELDASVMHGPTHRAGAVGALRNIKNPAAVAREVARRTDHVMLVGDGALRFAIRMGFKEQDLLTEQSRQAWLLWRSELNPDDDWLDPDEFDLPTPTAEKHSMAPRTVDGNLWERRGVPYTYGTIHCAAVTAAGDVGSCTTTSGLSWKLPGRVGDSPIIGAGNYCDNAIGAAGATGRGEAVMQVCGARTAVARMEAGDHPTDACLYVLKMIADHTRSKRLLDAKGRPNFDVTMYALRKDGAYGSAALWEGKKFAVSDAGGDRLEVCAFLYRRD